MDYNILNEQTKIIQRIWSNIIGKHICSDLNIYLTSMDILVSFFSVSKCNRFCSFILKYNADDKTNNKWIRIIMNKFLYFSKTAKFLPPFTVSPTYFILRSDISHFSLFFFFKCACHYRFIVKHICYFES